MKASLFAMMFAFAAVQGPLLTPPAAAPLDAAHCKCSIEVVVKRVGTGEPIPDVELQLQFINRPDPRSAPEGVPIYAGGPLSIRTAASGRAEFRDLPEGTYTVFAQRRGEFFFGANSGGFGNNTIQTSVHVGPREQRIQQVSFTMMTGGSISGRILDANHQPAHTAISAYHVEYRDGQRTLVAGLAEETDERGEYRLTQLPAGEYYIRTVTTSPQQNQSYYPGVLGPKSAVPVDVHEGEELHGIDFAIPNQKGVTISGTIINTFPGGDVQSDGKVLRAISSLYLVPRNMGFYFDFPQAISNLSKGSSNTNNGTEFPFEIHNVPPGSYDLYPLFVDTATDAHVNRYTSPTRIEVGTEDVQEVKAVIRGGTVLKVRVIRDDATLPSTELRNEPPLLPGILSDDLLGAYRQARSRSLTELQFRVTPRDSQPSLVPGDQGYRNFTVPRTGGEATISDMIEGSYRVLYPLSSPRLLEPVLTEFVADLRQGAGSVFDDGTFSLSKDSSDPLEVIIRSGGGTIQGTLDGNGQLSISPGLAVKLIPDPPRRQNLLLYKSVNVSQDGNGAFNFTGVAPGTYKLFAWESLPAGAEQNAEFISKYESRGISVTISAGLTLSNIKVPVIR